MEQHQPRSEHVWLQKAAGDWYVACAYFTAANQPPVKVQGSECVTSLGQFWTVTTFEADMMGLLIQGHATLGFDVINQCFISTWVDSSTPHLYRFKGQLDTATQTLTMSGENMDPLTGKLANYRSVETRNSDDHRDFALYVKTENRAETPVLRYSYTRKR